jgi:hypothetical protein
MASATRAEMGPARVGPTARGHRWLARRLYLDRAGGPERAVLVAGSGRSGTTWLAELLAGGRRRFLFEPLHPVRGPFPDLGVRRYVRPGTPDPALEDAVGAILAGRLRDRWTDQHNGSVLPTGRLVKDVWANLALGWIRERFPEVRIVLLLRHPAAVIRSQLSLARWDWHAEPARLLAQPDLVVDHLAGLTDLLRPARPGLDASVLTWCVENLVPLRALGPDGAHVIFYEHLVVRPERELRAIAAFLGEPFDARTLDRFGRPSALARTESAVVRGGDPATAWVDEVPPTVRARLAELVERAGLGRIYGEDPRPRVASGPEAFAVVRDAVNTG